MTERRIIGFALALLIAMPSAAWSQSTEKRRAGSSVAGDPKQPWSAEKLVELEEYEEDFKRYSQASDLHQERIRAILFREYKERTETLEARYKEQNKQTEEAHRNQHLNAMTLLREFLAKYPNHPQFTPDAMFRLADLLLDEANYLYNKEQELIAAGLKEAPPIEPPDPNSDEIPYEGPDYSKAMAMWRDIVTRFPEYRQADGVLYLLGYYLAQVGKERESTQVYLGLVCSNKFDPLGQPPPPLTREEIRAGIDDKAIYTEYEDCQPRSAYRELIEEAWVRGVGDAHFNTPGELASAIAAYRKVASVDDSKYYDEALYKLAWSYYRNDNFLEGITAFDESIAFSDKVVAEGGDPLELREEAVTYIAISFTDPWTSEEQVDPVLAYDRAYAFYKDRLDEPHVRDVYEKLGDTFKIIEAYEQAVDSWRITINKWPLHPRNPRVHQKIVGAYESMGDKDAADEEAAKLARRYAKGSEWYAANETNRQAMEDQLSIGQRMLRASAENRHRDAQLARKEWGADQTEENKQRYLALYTDAASLYQAYLEQYPDTTDIYEFTYRIADCMFFSEQYAKSVPYYRWVRDHRDLGDKYYLKSAVSIVQAYQSAVRQEIEANRLAEPPIPTTDGLKEIGTVEPMEIPPLYAELRDAYDEYQRLVEDPKTAPTMALAAALVSYRHLHFDDAIGRFDVVLGRFCGSDAAARAKDGLLVIYDQRGDNVKFKETNDKFIASQCGDEESIQLARAQNRTKEFGEAEDLFASESYDRAALSFYKYYRTAPDDDPNLPVALYNSAIAYERSGRPKTAIHLFGEFTNNQSEAFRASPYYVEALYLTAVAHQKAFDYQSAVDVYLNVVDLTGKRGTPEPPGNRSLAAIRLDALFNAALLRELDRVYKDPRRQPRTGAVSLYRRYYKLEKDERKRDRSLWAIARVYESARDVRNMEKIYAEWRKSFGRNPGNEQDYVFTFYNAAKMWEKKGSKKSAAKARKETIRAWQTVGSPKGTTISEMAAEFEFRTSERYYVNEFEPYKIKWPRKATQKAVKRTFDKLDQITDDTQKRFLDLAQYESSTWGFAALVRVGDVQFFSAQKLIDAPAPKDIQRLDNKYPEKGILAAYQDQVEQLVKPKTEAAVSQWKKVVDAAKTQGVSNRWTQLAQERLHDYVSPDEYPVLRDEIIETTEQ